MLGIRQQAIKNYMILDRLTIFSAQCRDWLLYRELMALSRRESFEGVVPESITTVLHKFAESRLHSQIVEANAKKITNPEARAVAVRTALLAIWELSKNESRTSPALRFKWARVMATCNSVYAPFALPADEVANR